MKKLTIICLLVFLLGKSYATIANPIVGVKDSIELRGTVYNNNDRVKGLIINVYKNNTLFKKVKVKTSNRVRTYLPTNSVLTIEITAPGFHAKRFMFDTTIPAGLKPTPKYSFDIDIFQEKELAGVNTSILDFPVGLVEFDEKKSIFVRNKKYTKRMKKAYLKLWEESQMAERSGLDKEEEEE